MSGFPVLSPDVSRGRALEDEVTLPSSIEEQDRLAEEAREVLPYSFDECTWAKGPSRQNVWSCSDCNEKGVCYGCSISCHADHRLVESWTRRGFTCDCPTTSMCPEGKKHKCTSNPPEKQPQPPNEGNRYSKNFSGTFCRCGRDYDPETEVEAMINCIGCEDWSHESCLNSQPRRTAPVEDDEDEEALCLIPSESYDGLVCAECVSGCPLSLERAGSEGWMVVEPTEEGSFVVLGRSEVVTTGAKRDHAGEEQEGKRARLDDAARSAAQPSTDKADKAQNTETREAKPELSKPEIKQKAPRKGSGDLFLAHGMRARSAKELDATSAATLPFPLVDEEIYEPPADTDPAETSDQVTERVVGSSPRVQAIEASHGFQNMKDKSKVMLQSRAESGSAVSREDIESFFADSNKSRR